MGDVIEYQGKDGVYRYIYKNDALWMKQHPDILNEDYLYMALDIWKASRSKQISSRVDVFEFIRQHSKIETLDEAERLYDCPNRAYQISHYDLRDYLSIESIEKIAKEEYDEDEGGIWIYELLGSFRAYRRYLKTPDGKSWEKDPYGSIIIAYRCMHESDPKWTLDEFLISYLIYSYRGSIDLYSGDYIVSYVLKYANDPNYMDKVGA